MGSASYRRALSLLLTLTLAAVAWVSGPSAAAGVHAYVAHPNGADTRAAAAMQTAALTFAPTDDARVVESHPATNYGTTTTLRADGDTNANIQSYLRFDLADLPGAIQSATLRLYAGTDDSPDGPAVYAADSTWSETDITWDNRPALTSAVLADTGPIALNTWAEYDVTAAITGTGSYTFVLVSNTSDGITFFSRQGSVPPELVVTLADSSTTTPTGTPTDTPLPTPTDTPLPTPTGTPADNDPVLVGAGDIASCSGSGDEATAALLDDITGTVITLGDNVYSSGTAREFADCYGPSWGRHKERTRPSAGNHDYRTNNASGYFDYFGAAAGDPSRGYYSYDLGAWHIVVINSNCAEVGGCQTGSPQEQWLRADLAAHPAACTLAYWHHPRFSSGSSHGSSSSMEPIWRTLYDANAELVLSGHEHNYERFAPQDPAGQADDARGIREFVVGTGGGSHYGFDTPLPNSEVRNSDTFGVLKLTLHPGSYDWQFVPIAGKSFSDSGTNVACH